MYTAVLLDVDGTLVDSNDAHAHAWTEVLGRHGYDVSFSRVRRMIGMGGDRLVEEVCGIPRGDKRNEQIGSERTDAFLERWIATVRPLRGARDLVLRLRNEGYRYVIASAAKDNELAPLLEIAEIADLVPARTSSSDVEESKPAPDIIEAALAHVLDERSRAVLVGDTPYDARAARDAHVAFIGVTSGGWPAEALAGAIAVYEGPLELARAQLSGGG
jgi:phosphoglycolate phosphatase-like HAD superfamily hydrolase